MCQIEINQWWESMLNSGPLQTIVTVPVSPLLNCASSVQAPPSLSDQRNKALINIKLPWQTSSYYSGQWTNCSTNPQSQFMFCIESLHKALCSTTNQTCHKLHKLVMQWMKINCAFRKKEKRIEQRIIIVINPGVSTETESKLKSITC